MHAVTLNYGLSKFVMEVAKKSGERYRKIPKISPSMYDPCTWKIALKYKVKQNKNGKFTSNC